MLNRKLVLASLFGLVAVLVFLGGTGDSGKVEIGGAENADASVTPPPQRAVNDRGRMYRECMVLGDQTQSPWRDCVYGNRRSDTHVVLLGDSQALHWGPALIRIANQRNWRLTALMRQGCTVAQVVFERVCDQWRSNVMRRIIRRENPDLVVVSTGTTRRFAVKRGGRRLDPVASIPYLRKGMQFTLRRLVNTGARVALIRDQHRAVPRPPDCIMQNRGRHPNRACWFRPTNRIHEYNWDHQAGRNTPGVRVINPNPMLCPNGNACPVVRGGMLMYRDTYHLTATFARSLAPWLYRQLPQASKWK